MWWQGQKGPASENVDEAGRLGLANRVLSSGCRPRQPFGDRPFSFCRPCHRPSREIPGGACHHSTLCQKSNINEVARTRINQATREIDTRFDFKGNKRKVRARGDGEITMRAPDEFQLNQMYRHPHEQ